MKKLKSMNSLNFITYTSAIILIMAVFTACSKDDEINIINEDYVEITVADSWVGKDIRFQLDGKDNEGASNISADLNNDGKIDQSEKVIGDKSMYYFKKVPSKFKLYGNFGYINLSAAVSHINLKNYPKLDYLMLVGPITYEVSPNNKITHFSYHLSNANSLDVTKFPNIKALSVSGTELNTIDLSKAIDLELLQMEDCGLTSINFSNNKKLKSIEILFNNINQNNMQLMVNSIPERSKDDFNSITVFGSGYPNKTDKNYITKAQVNTLKSKGWSVFQTVYKGPNSTAREDYIGR